MLKLVSVCKFDITIMFFGKLPERNAVLVTRYKIMLPTIKVVLDNYFKQCIISRTINRMSLKY